MIFAAALRDRLPRHRRDRRPALRGRRGGRLAFGAANRGRLRRVEEKLDLLLARQGIAYGGPNLSALQELAAAPHRKIEAIKVYREQYGVGLAEARKRAVEEYQAGRA